MIKVKKYNKKTQPFSAEKIVESIHAAVVNSKHPMPETKMNKIAETIEKELTVNNIKTISTDDIATFVEKSLMNSSYKEAAKSYITYRHDKQQEHVYNSDLIKAFKKKLSGMNVENANANSDERSFSGRMKEASSVLFKDDALSIMSKQHKSNHLNNRIYVHDLDSYSSGQHNCLSIPFDNLFKNGVAIRQTDLRQPKAISTAMQLTAVIIQIQSLQQFGGVAATHIDWTLVPYVRYTLIKNLAECIAYEQDEDDDSTIVNAIQNKIFVANKVAYTVLSSNAYKSKLYDILNDSSIDFINQLDTIACNILSLTPADKQSKALRHAIKKTKKDTKQGAEGLIHNLNSLQSRSGCETLVA